MPQVGIRAGLIGVLTDTPPRVGIFADMLQAVEQVLRPQGFAPLLVFDRDPAARIRQAQEWWEGGQISGFIHIGSADLGSVPTMPGVVIGETPQADKLSQVVVDNAGAGRRIGEHLWELGHRTVLFVTQPSSRLVGNARLRGLRDYWSDRGAASPPAVISVERAGLSEAQTIDALRAAFQTALEAGEPPTALFADTDLTAIWTIRTLQAMGRRVPEDVSVVGFDDTALLAAHFQPPLTTVRMPSLMMGTLAAQMLLEQIAQPQSPPRHLRIPADLIIRGSSGPARPCDGQTTSPAVCATRRGGTD